MVRKRVTADKENKEPRGEKAGETKSDDHTSGEPGGAGDQSAAPEVEEQYGDQPVSNTDTASVGEEALMEKLAEMQDRYLRLSAEFDNYRKRTLKEKIDLTKTAAESVLLKLLPVLDDFERGVKLMDTAKDCNAMKEGIDLIYSKFRSFLDQNGVKEIEAINKEFDVDLHDAVTKVPAAGKAMKGKVVDVLEKGYILNDKVIRFSKVVVGE